MTKPERLAALLLYLQSRRSGAARVTAGEIAEHFGISRRTVLRDMGALIEIGVPIESADGVSGGYTLPPEYPIAPLPLSHREALLLLFALGGLASLPVAPFGNARETLSAKLRAMLSGSQREAVDSWLDTLSVDVPERPRQKAPFLDMLLDAAHRGSWVAALYQSESGGEAAHTLLPRRITTTGGFWYCRAWSHERSAERTFRVDRFLGVTVTPCPPGAAPLASGEGIAYDHPDHPLIYVRLTAGGVSVAEQEAHLGDTVVRHDDGTGSLCFRCPPSELRYWAGYFFRLAGNADVLGPPELRANIRELAQKVCDSYAEQ